MTANNRKERPFILEWCVESTADILRHLDQVDQIEWCADLELEGLTPPLDEAAKLIMQAKKPVKVMIRNRDGDFDYTSDEIGDMIATAKKFQEMGFDRFVFGAIRNRRLDVEAIAAFAAGVYPSKVCVHKAIDLSTDMLIDARMLMDINNVDSILTSGGAATALDGASLIRKMIELTKDRLTIIAAGKVTYENIDGVHEAIGASCYHGKAIIKRQA
ncbi:MAG: copper homeostasis protein CutC [Saprospiraceae bacterium]|nr:copper homeostasis protein CutC [Saprospiraceae bacterium]